MSDRRGGFTLVELVVVSVLGAFVLGAILQVLITSQRTYTGMSAVIEGQQASRMALELLFTDLRELSPSGGDIVHMDSDRLEVRLMRRFGIVCEADLDASPPTLKVLNHAGERFAEESVFLFAENNPGTASDDVWIIDSIVAVDTTSTCLSGRPASVLEFAPSGPFLADTVRVGAAVRGFDEYRFYLDTWNGDPYLVRSENGVAWPVAGPLAAADGLQFTYRDAMGSVTNTPTDVRQIEVLVRARPGVQNALGRQVADSITAWIYTRN